MFDLDKIDMKLLSNVDFWPPVIGKRRPPKMAAWVAGVRLYN